MSVDVSIVIPTYRRPALLKRCLATLTIQDFPRQQYEIIVVSDGPDEVTGQLVERMNNDCRQRPEIIFDFLPKRKGPAAVRNRGWHIARGELIAFTDDDCIPNIFWISALWDSYHRQGMVALRGRVIVPKPTHPTDYEQNVSHLETASFVTANCSCTRQALKKVHGFDERFSVAWREDSDLEFKLLRHHIPVRYVKEASIIHPVRNTCWGISLKEQRKSMYNALLYKKHPALYRKSIQRHPPWIYYGIIFSFLWFWTGLLMGTFWFTVPAFLSWLVLQNRFILKRLSGNSKRIDHVAEMIVTSLFIPFLSVFWRIYGGVKFNVFFL